MFRFRLLFFRCLVFVMFFFLGLIDWSDGCVGDRKFCALVICCLDFMIWCFEEVMC